MTLNYVNLLHYNSYDQRVHLNITGLSDIGHGEFVFILDTVRLTTTCTTRVVDNFHVRI